MSIEESARAEGEKRWLTVGDFSAVAALRVEFINGYIAGASRPVTDAEVEAAAAAIAAMYGHEPTHPYQVEARAALEAAREVLSHEQA